MSIQTTDHLGKTYSSVSAMCRAYGITKQVYAKRRRSGWSIEEALADHKRKFCQGKTATDHLGNTYRSIRQMCQVYGIPENVYHGRCNTGWSVKDALTTPVDKKPERKLVADHLGNTYESTSQMCRAYGISDCTYSYRRKNGWSVEKALTTSGKGKRDKTPAVDHLGNTYKSVNAMCIRYGITESEYLYRIKKGWSIRKALTEPVRKRKGENHGKE